MQGNFAPELAIFLIGCILEPEWMLMATITLKNIPEELYRAIKLMAKSHQRSLNNEIIFRIQESLGYTTFDPEKLRNEAREFRNRVRSGLTSDQIKKAINEGRE